MEALIKADVLDRGSVELLAILGDDFLPVRAARTSYLSDNEKTELEDVKLLRYLYINGHHSPFEMNQLVWRIKAPLFVITHFLRHRSFSFNQQSGRYTEYQDDYYLPTFWRMQDTKNKQGSLGLHDDSNEFSFMLDNHARRSIQMYKEALSDGIAKEMARYFLPASIFYHYIWVRTDLRNLLHFFDLRTSEAAQWETRQYAEAMVNITKSELPHTIKLWEEMKGKKVNE